jgi:uncharacterized zinc-type alcohol dehydrogenase-like protein
MYNTKAYSAASATSPLASPRSRGAIQPNTTFRSRSCSAASATPISTQVRNEWSGVMPTVYPIVPGHEIVGRVTKVGSAVTKYKPGDLAAVGCMVDSDGTCPECKAGLEQFCPNPTFTSTSPDKHLGGVTYGGYSDSVSSSTNASSCASLRTSISPEPRRSSAPGSPLTRPCATGASPRARRSASWASADWATWA